MALNPRSSRNGSANNTSEPGGIFQGKITLVYNDGSLRVFVKMLGINIGPCRVVGKQHDEEFVIDDEVLVAYLDNQKSEMVVIGRLTDRPGIEAATTEPIGHEDKTESAISFNNSTRVFTIAPVGDSFNVWCLGKRYTKTAAESITLPDTTGLYYIYYSSTGVLSSKTSFFTWDQDAPTAYIYYNSVTAEAEFFADERHGVTLDWATHEYLHRTRGASLAEGLGASGYTLAGTGSSNADMQISIENGTFFDEDLEVNITHSATPTANTWEQRLQSPAYIPMFYRFGSGGSWRLDTATAYPVKYGSTRATYNLSSGGTWSTPDMTSGKFGITWIVATNNLNEPVIGILGQTVSDNIGQAEDVSYADLDLTGLPIVEIRPLYKLIYETNTGYTNAVKSRLASIADIRANQAINIGIGASALSSLTDVGLTTTAANDILAYNGSNWTNTNTPTFQSATIIGGVTVDTSTFSVDATNNRVGIGTVSPSTALQVVGTVTATAFTGALTGNVSGTATTVTTNANLTGDVTSVGNATTLTNAPVIAKVLTGYASGAGTVAATDSILQAIQKLNGNNALKADIASPTFTGTPTLPTGTIATTQTAADSSTKVATTAFVTTADNLKANIASPTFTGVPLSTTAAIDTNTTQIATTAYVVGQGYAKLASPTFTGTVTVPTPTNSTDAVTKAYADAITQSLDIKDSVRVASTANIVVASALINGSTIDGVVVATGDRVLLKNQTDGTQNGIYVVVASGAASRSTDANTSAKVTSGMYVFVSEGTVSADMGYVLTTNDTITLGTTALSFTQFSGAGQITAGTGLSKSGNTLSINTAVTADLTTAQTFTNKTLTSPVLTTPTLGVASATTVNKITLTPPATAATLTIADGKTLTASNTLTLTGTDASSVAFGTGGTVAYTNVATLSSLTSVGTLTGLTIGGAGANRSITINAPTGYYAIQYFAINGTNEWHYEVNPAGDRWSLVESTVAERIGVTSTGATFSGTVTATTFSGSGASLTSLPASQLSGTTLASGVTASSLTSLGTLTSLTVTGASSFGSEILATTSIAAGRGVGIRADPTNASSILQFTNNATSAQWSSIVATNNLLNVTTPFSVAGTITATSNIGWSASTYLTPVTGGTTNYGSVKVTGTPTSSGWSGYSINGDAVFMSQSVYYGLYDNTNLEWGILCTRNGTTELFHNGSSKIQTTSTGATTTGTHTATTFSGALSGNATTATTASNVFGSGSAQVYLMMTTGPGIGYTGATIGGGANNLIGFRWTNPSVNCTVDNVISAEAANFSDRRLKTNIVTYAGGLDAVRNLRPVKFNPLDIMSFTDDGEPIVGDNDPYDEMIGFIADEMQEVIPSAISGTGNQLKSVSVLQVLSVAVSATKELDAKVTSLMERIETLENK